MQKKRQQDIIYYINQKEHVSFRELCEVFHVSNATMRRDLTTLDSLGLIDRVHGGANAVAKSFDASHHMDDRLYDQVQEKEIIAQKALTFLEDGDSILLDASTTCLIFAKQIKQSHIHITVITNDFAIVNELKDAKSIELFFIGGYVNKEFFSTTGIITEQLFETLQYKYAFMSFDGIDPLRGISTNRFDGIEIKKSIISHAQTVVCLADSTKFKSVGVLPIVDLDSIDYIITTDLSKEILNSFDSYKKKIIISK